MKTINYLLLLFATISIATTPSCRCKKPEVICSTTQVMQNGVCVNDSSKGGMYNGQWVQYGVNLINAPYVYMSSGGNCGDWRDSIFISLGSFNKSMTSFFFNQLPSISGWNVAADCMADISYYDERPTTDTFNCLYAWMDYHHASRGPRGLALFGSVNKARDSVWLRVYNANSLMQDYHLYDYCDKILVRIK